VVGGGWATNERRRKPLTGLTPASYETITGLYQARRGFGDQTLSPPRAGQSLVSLGLIVCFHSPNKPELLTTTLSALLVICQGFFDQENGCISICIGPIFKGRVKGVGFRVAGFYCKMTIYWQRMDSLFGVGIARVNAEAFTTNLNGCGSGWIDCLMKDSP